MAEVSYCNSFVIIVKKNGDFNDYNEQKWQFSSFAYCNRYTRLLYSLLLSEMAIIIDSLRPYRKSSVFVIVSL